MTEQDAARLSPELRALREQIRTDPRLAATGSLYITPDMLRRLYPNAPASWGFSRGDVVLPNDSLSLFGGMSPQGGPPQFGGGRAPSFGLSTGGDVPTFDPRTPGSAPRTSGGGFVDGLKDFFTNPRNLIGLAALTPSIVNSFRGGGGSGSGGLSESGLLDEAREGMALQRKRLEQTQPVFDTLVRMAYGRTPKAYRGAPPEGYQPPAQQYPYSPPRFGGR